MDSVILRRTNLEEIWKRSKQEKQHMLQALRFQPLYCTKRAIVKNERTFSR